MVQEENVRWERREDQCFDERAMLWSSEVQLVAREAGVAGRLKYLLIAWTGLGTGCLRSLSVGVIYDISHVTSISGSRERPREGKVP